MLPQKSVKSSSYFLFSLDNPESLVLDRPSVEGSTVIDMPEYYQNDLLAFSCSWRYSKHNCKSINNSS